MEYKTNELWKLAEEYRIKAKEAFTTKNLEETARLAQDAARLFKMCGDDYQYAKCLNFLGVIYANMGEESMAVDYYLEGLECAKENRFYDILSIFFNNIGSRYQKLGQHDTAIVYFEKALAACCKEASHENEAEEDREEQWDNLFVYELNLAISYQKLGNPTEASHHLRVAENAMERGKIKDFDLAVLTVKCSIFWDMGNHGYIKEHLDELMWLSRNLNVLNDYIQNVQELAEVLNKAGEYESWRGLLRTVEEVAYQQNRIYYHLVSVEMRMEYYYTIGEMEEYNSLCIKHSKLCRQQKKVECRERIKALDTHIALKEIEEERREAQAQAETDFLTGVGNRYGLEKKSRQLIQQLRSSDKPITVGILDVDCFKEMNDTYGHNAGDDCLRQVADILQSAVDSYGSVFRFGGDEFVILMPEGNYEAAERVAERIKRKLEEASIENVNSTVAGTLTLSQGYACFKPDEGEHLAGLLEHADKALYKIKGRGKNGWIILEEYG